MTTRGSDEEESRPSSRRHTQAAYLQPLLPSPCGYDVYDPVNVGFKTDWPEKERTGWRFDTSERGNSNKGHNYGTEMSADEKRALLEYLKTF